MEELIPWHWPCFSAWLSFLLEDRDAGVWWLDGNTLVNGIWIEYLGRFLYIYFPSSTLKVLNKAYGTLGQSPVPIFVMIWLSGCLVEKQNSQDLT
jgi:hypothetical protein